MTEIDLIVSGAQPEQYKPLLHGLTACDDGVQGPCLKAIAGAGVVLNPLQLHAAWQLNSVAAKVHARTMCIAD